MAAGSLCVPGAEALSASRDISFHAPGTNSVLSPETVLTGYCVGKNPVHLSGPGLSRAASLACDGSGNSARSWHYLIRNVYAGMPAGKVTITVEQNGNTAIRTFVKSGVASSSATATATATTAAAVAAAPAVSVPANAFDLRPWKLTLPVDKNGKATVHEAVSVYHPALDQQYPPYFTVSGGRLIFSAPTTGATTGGTEYPRSELREMTPDGKKPGNWYAPDGGTLSASLRIIELPRVTDGTLGRIVIGQIHADPVDCLNRIYYDNGNLYFDDDRAGSKQKLARYYLKDANGNSPKIPVGADFSYTIKVADGVQTVTAVYRGVTYRAVDPLSAHWDRKTPVYFKAGAYVQVGAVGGDAKIQGTGRGTVAFNYITVPEHPGK